MSANSCSRSGAPSSRCSNEAIVARIAVSSSLQLRELRVEALDRAPARRLGVLRRPRDRARAAACAASRFCCRRVSAWACSRSSDRNLFLQAEHVGVLAREPSSRAARGPASACRSASGARSSPARRRRSPRGAIALVIVAGRRAASRAARSRRICCSPFSRSCVFRRSSVARLTPDLLRQLARCSCVVYCVTACFLLIELRLRLARAARAGTAMVPSASLRPHRVVLLHVERGDRVGDVGDRLRGRRRCSSA